MTALEKLKSLAANLWWSWNPEAVALFRELNPSVFKATMNNPVAAIRAADDETLADDAFGQKLDAVYDDFQAYMKSDGTYSHAPRTSYFCMEYGIHESLPLYAGGLGILAGDHAKAASDLGLPFTAVGLFLRDGYFRQFFDKSGMQQEEYPALDPGMHPVELYRDEHGKPITVTVHLAHEPLQLQAWKIQLGRTTMIMLDSDMAPNAPEFRGLTRRLYQNGRAVRIQQEIILGIGGLRMLRALGIETDVYHMNEGHCAFLTLELLRECLTEGNVLSDHSLDAAEQWVRDRCVFTTHTPVMAGHDRFSPELFLEQMVTFRESMGFSEHDLLSYGRVNANDIHEEFTMTVLALRFARASNGVSKLHGEVARRQWHHMYQDTGVEDVPIRHITNGVHLPTWTAATTQQFFKEKLGDWKANRNAPAFWEQVNEVADADLWAMRNQLRGELVEYVNASLKHHSLNYSRMLDPEALTIGFARRFAPYKRATLLFQDMERAVTLFGNQDRPVQFLFAGKAHPANMEGKRLIRTLYEVSRHPVIDGRLIILENYNMEIGRMLVSGSDVWLNNPRRPYEASGTSGQKVPAHGGLNVSILDGWWPEGYNGKNGWPIGHESSADIKDPGVQDAEDVRFLHDTMINEVVPAFFERDEKGIPTKWVAMMRDSIRTLPAAFSAERMLTEYIETMYQVQEDAMSVS